MAQNLSALLSSLDSTKKTAAVAGKYEISELTLAQQRKMIASIFDTIEAPARLALSFNEIIRECVRITDTSVNEITIIDRPFLLRSLRDLIVGNSAVKVIKNEEGVETRTEYEFTTNDYSKFTGIKPSETIIIDETTKIHLAAPTLTRDNMVNNQLLDKINSYRKNLASEKKQIDGGQVAVFYFTYELVKYIDSIETAGNIFKFSDLLINEQLRVIDHLKTPVIEPIVEFIKQAKEGEKYAFTAVNTTTGELENIAMEHTIFSLEI